MCVATTRTDLISFSFYRLRANKQNEVEMLEKQANGEYELLQEKLQENSYIISSRGEQCIISKEDPVSPTNVLHNNIRDKYLKAEEELERYTTRCQDIQKKVSEKEALIGSHVSRLQQLQQKEKHLGRDGGGVQKVKSVVRAILREDNDQIGINQINEDSSPSELLKYITECFNSLSTLEVSSKLLRWSRDSKKWPSPVEHVRT